MNSPRIEYGLLIDNKIIEGAETAFVDNKKASPLDFRPLFLSNDYQEGRKVFIELEKELNNCSSFSFSVAFVTLGGITPLLETFSRLEKQGVPGKILTTDYLSFSDPRALEKLESFSNIEVRMFRSNSESEVSGFHTKGYIFDRTDGSQHVIVGSSNLTQTALTANKEWNVKLISSQQGEFIQELHSEFIDLWLHAVPLSDYIETYRKMYLEKKKILSSQKLIPYSQASLKPNSMQIAFISRLDALIEEGAKRALLISATGTGKTYASAFAVRHLSPKKVLFLVHREQILRDAQESYKRVFGEGLNSGILSGTEKDINSDFLFSTVQTMSQSETLHSFKKDHFDVIVVDEAHRAGASSYQKILDYFQPDFCLGMSATPERSDNFDIYQLFDNNIAYEIRLQQALQENLLCPFHYFGISDISVEGAPIDDFSGFSALTSNERVKHITKHAKLFGHSGSRLKGLIFCRNNKESAELSRKMNKLGYRTLALSGNNSQKERSEAVERLTCDENSNLYEDRLDYILTVDIFNEGIDIPDVNQVIMLRPTESAIVFVQQLGRGLRKADEKEFVVVIDFIGNYTNSYLIPIALSGDRSFNKDCMRRDLLEGSRIIPGCSTIHFDKIAQQQIFESINESKTNLNFLHKSYRALKQKMGKIPRMIDFFDFGEIDPMLFIESSKKSYYRFLDAKEKDWDFPLTKREQEYIEFFSQNIANGIRVHELLFLELLLDGKQVTEKLLAQAMLKHGFSLEPEAFKSAARVLNGSFFTNKYSVSVSRETSIGYEVTEEFDSLLHSEAFCFALKDILGLAWKRFDKFYQSGNNDFARYGKYMRKDVCRILDWDKDESSTMYGYAVKHGTCPIFVTYDKAENIEESLDYKERFIDRSTFAWQSRHGDGISSKRVSQIIAAQKTGLRVMLFIKKNDDEGLDFYYMGELKPKAWTENTTKHKGKTEPISDIVFELDKPVRDDIYDYLVG